MPCVVHSLIHSFIYILLLLFSCEWGNNTNRCQNDEWKYTKKTHKFTTSLHSLSLFLTLGLYTYIYFICFPWTISNTYFSYFVVVSTKYQIKKIWMRSKKFIHKFHWVLLFRYNPCKRMFVMTGVLMNEIKWNKSIGREKHGKKEGSFMVGEHYYLLSITKAYYECNKKRCKQRKCLFYQSSCLFFKDFFIFIFKLWIMSN